MVVITIYMMNPNFFSYTIFFDICNNNVYFVPIFLFLRKGVSAFRINIYFFCTFLNIHKYLCETINCL